MFTSDLRRRIVWLIAARVLLSTTLLGWAILMQVRSPAIETRGFHVLIALAYGLSLVFGVTARLADRYRWLLDVQLACDALLVSLFVAFTGGINSYFSSLFFLPIIAGGTLQLRRGALTVAVFTGLLYVAVVLCQYQDVIAFSSWLSPADTPLPAARFAFYTIAINVLAYVVVGFLAGSLAEGVRSAGVRLERASNEIQDLRAINEHVVNSLTSGLVTSDYEGRILTFNRAAESITGQSAAETIGRSSTEVLQLPPSFLPSLEADLDQGTRRRLDYTYRTGDGRTIDMGLSATYLVTPGGRAGLLFNFQDVTAIKKLERDARVQHRLAAVGEMAAGIAHEIRNPLASISGSIQVLRQELQLREDQGQLMDIVIRESERLNGIITSFLAYARPKRYAVTRLDLARVITDTAVLLRNSTEVGEHHRIELDVPPGEVPYDADEGQVRQIIWNLATNALRAMPDGGCLRLGARIGTASAAAGVAVNGDVVLTVEDEGVGIKTDELDQIFQPFHSTFEKGSGLGLAIVHRIVSDYGGEIQVTSKPGAGTRVSVRLPGRAATV